MFFPLCCQSYLSLNNKTMLYSYLRTHKLPFWNVYKSVHKIAQKVFNFVYNFHGWDQKHHSLRISIKFGHYTLLWKWELVWNGTKSLKLSKTSQNHANLGGYDRVLHPFCFWCDDNDLPLNRGQVVVGSYVGLFEAP